MGEGLRVVMWCCRLFNDRYELFWVYLGGFGDDDGGGDGVEGVSFEVSSERCEFWVFGE